MKGDSALSIILILVVVFGAVIAAAAGHYILSQMRSIMSGDEQFMKGSVDSLSTIESLDGGMAFLTALSLLAILVGALIIDSHPVFFIFSLITGIVMMFVVPIISNTFGSLSVGQLSESFGKFPIMAQVWQNAPILSGVVMFLVIVILYGKSQYA